MCTLSGCNAAFIYLFIYFGHINNYNKLHLQCIETNTNNRILNFTLYIETGNCYRLQEKKVK